MVPIPNTPKTTGLAQLDSTVSSLLHPGCGLEWVVQFLDYLWGIILGHGMVVSGVFGVAGSATPGGALRFHPVSTWCTLDSQQEHVQRCLVPSQFKNIPANNKY